MKFKNGEIEGVITKKLTRFSDERGYLLETFRTDNLPNKLKPMMSYISYTSPGVTRGPHEHEEQTDIFCFMGPGNFKIRLWDNRKSSKSFGNYKELIGGKDNPIQVVVPPGVVHGYKNISEKTDGMVINCPDKLYRGWGKKEEVDEIRHEDKEDEFYLDFIKEDKSQMIWLIGKKGMLGSDIEKLLKEKRMAYWASDREVDIIDYKALDKFAKDKKINWIINCAGYTRVDKSEEEIEESFRLNRDGVRNLGLLSNKRKIKLIHISADYVFDGRKERTAGYSEDDKTNPINTYGKSKLAGEEEIKKTLVEYFIIRTAWLYGKEGNNFVYTMLRLFRERDLVKVVEDQWGSPTYTVDLAEVILKIIKSDSEKSGIYHFTNEGVTTWYAFAQVIYNKAKKLGLLGGKRQVEIRPIKTNEYPTLAKRPDYSVLSKDKIKKEFNLKIRSWEEALEDFLSFLKIKEEKLKGKERQ